MSIAEKFEQKIHQGNLPKPVPKWFVVAKRIVLWSFLVIVSLVGALSAGVAAWFMADPVALARDAGNAPWFEFFLQALPLFWALVTIICGIIAILIFAKSPHGYKYRTTYVALACVIAFLALGTALASAGISDKIEGIAAEYMPQYHIIAKPRMMQLMQPDAGFILGRIQSVDGTMLIVRDPRGESWQVQVNSETRVPLHLKIQIGDCIRVIGDASSTIHITQADDIRPCPRGIRPPPIKRVQ